MTTFGVVAQDVRDYLQVTGNVSTGQYNDGLISSNIRAAASLLQRMTHRQFEQQTNVTKLFTARGRTSIGIPDLQTASPTISLNSATLTLNSSAYLIPDRMNTGVYTAVEFPGYARSLNYRAIPSWFDRNLDSWYWAGGYFDELPNNLSIGPATWGWVPGTYPDELLLATKAMAGWFTLRPDALLTGVLQLSDGVFANATGLPPEIGIFVQQYRIDADAAVTVG